MSVNTNNRRGGIWLGLGLMAVAGIALAAMWSEPGNRFYLFEDEPKGSIVIDAVSQDAEPIGVIDRSLAAYYQVPLHEWTEFKATLTPEQIRGAISGSGPHTDE